MAGNHSFQQFPMNWNNRVQNSQYQNDQDNIMKAMANLSNGLSSGTSNSMNTQMDTAYSRQPPTYVNQVNNHQNGQWFQTHSYKAHLTVTSNLLAEARKEMITNSSQYERRRKLQQYLLGYCNDPALAMYIKNEFIQDFCSVKTFEVLHRVTGLDTSKFKATLLSQGLSNNPNQQAQFQQNFQGNQFIPDNFQSQNAGTVGNFNQFQLQGSNKSRNSSGRLQYSQGQMNNSLHFSQQSSRSSFPQDNVILGAQPPQQSRPSPTSQRWYTMPTETYEAGRVVKDQGSPFGLPSVTVPSATVPLSHFGDSVNNMPRSSLAQSLNPVERQSNQHNFSNQSAQSILPAASDMISPRSAAQLAYNRQNIPQTQHRSGICENNIQRNHSKIKPSAKQPEGRQSQQNMTVSAGKCSSQSPQDSKEQLRKMVQQFESSNDNISHSKVQDSEAGSSVQQSLSNEAESPAIPVQQAELNSDGNTNNVSDDITELFSMPVLCENVEEPKETAIRPDQISHAKFFDDMNVLSPFTANVVSDSVDNWLAGSKHSDILERVGASSQKEIQQIKPAASVAPSDCIAKVTENNQETNVSANQKVSKSTTEYTSADVNAFETHVLDLYDPPLPVIKIRRREDRISPLGKSNAEKDKMQKMMDHETTKNSITRYPEEKEKQSGDIESLGSLKGKCTTDLHNINGQKTNLQNEHLANPEKCRHKSSEVSSSSSPRHGEQNKKPNEKDSESLVKTDSQKHGDVDKNATQDKSEQFKSNIELSGKDKLFSEWEKSHIGNKAFKGHNRRKSCNDQVKPGQCLNRERRSLTWNGSSISDKSSNRDSKYDQSKRPVPPNGKLVDFNSHLLLQIKIPDGKFLIMHELIATCFRDHDVNFVYRAKTAELGVNNITLTHICRKEVVKYLDFMKIQYPSQLNIVSLSNAQKLFDYLEHAKCNQQPVGDSEEPLENSSDIKKRSASPDSTVHAVKRSQPEGSTMTTAEQIDHDDLQQNKVSSQSQDDVEDPNLSELSHISALEDHDNEDASSNVSDATDIYCDGKPFINTSGGGSGDGNSELRVPLGLDGGLAVVERGNLPNFYIRFVVVRGNKCFLYKDLFRIFGQAEVVKVVVNNYMQVKTCTSEEAEFFNRNQTGMISVDPVDDSLIHEKYVRKVFHYFGESFPKQKRPIDADVKNNNLPLKRSGDHQNSEPAAKKARYGSEMVDGCDTVRQDEKGIETSDSSKKINETMNELCTEMAAEIAKLKAQLKETKASNLSLERKYKLYSDNLIVVKRDLDELQEKNTLLEKESKTREENIAEIRRQLDEKDETIEKLQKERDHFKYFVEKITDTYKDNDDGSEEMECFSDVVLDKEDIGVKF